MATTYTDASFGVRAIGARTDSSGGAVTDMTAEEDRFAQEILSEGVISPADSFLPVAGAGWDLDVGSGGTKTDYFLVEGTGSAGMANYIVRLPSDTAVTINASHGSLDRIDEVYLVVQDNAYDSSSRALPRLAYRDGTAAGSPTAPGPDGGWDAYALLATIDVPGGSANIAAATITDERAFSAITLAGSDRIGADSAGSTIVSAPSGGEIEFQINGTTEAKVTGTGFDVGGGAIANVSTVDLVDVAAHDHDGSAAGGVQLDHAGLSNLTTGDPHTQYQLESGLSAAVALLAAATAGSADTLTTSRTISLSGDASGSIGFDGSSNVTIVVTVADDSHTHDGRYYTESEINSIADQHFGYYSDAASTTPKKITRSTSAASGGADEDIWLQYV